MIKANFKENNNVIPADFGEVIVIKPDGPAFVDTSDATATELSILEGDTAYVNGKRLTGTIPKIQGTEITPSAQDTVAVNKGVYTEGDIVVKGDENLRPENIVEGKEIYGVKGSHVNKGALELLYTEGAEITPEDWGSDEIAFSTDVIMTGTKCESVELPHSLVQCIGLQENTNLKEFTASAIVGMAKESFKRCTNLEKISLPNLLNISTGAFSYCSNLGVAYFPSVTTITTRCFIEAGKKGSKLILPQLGSVPGYSFNSVPEVCNFTVVDFGICGSIGSNALGLFPNLKALVVRRTSDVCTSATPMFWGGYYPNKTYTAYVPALTDSGEDMVALYKSATNWTVIANRIKPFYLAETVEDIPVLLADESIAEGSMIICDVDHSYTIKGGDTL